MMLQLLHTNRLWLQQAAGLLNEIGDEAYTASPEGLKPHRAGGHLRHILEFYECFLDGMKRGYVDYDARRRDERVETQRTVALARIERIVAQLAELDKLNCDARVWVKAEASEAKGVLGNFLASSVGRELQVLSSHTVHHFALMAVTLRLLGVNVPADFGVAPSTLRHQASKAAA